MHRDALVQPRCGCGSLGRAGVDQTSSQAGRALFSVTGQSSEAIVFSLLSLQDGVTAPNVRFQLISKLFGQTLRCVFSVVVVILEVENKAA